MDFEGRRGYNQTVAGGWVAAPTVRVNFPTKGRNPMENPNRTKAYKIAQAVENAGGRAYYVGGFVRDALRGQESKDVDIEVHGIPAPQLEAILDTLGERTQMGASFGVYGLKHYDIDIAMPRKEEATGQGHRDFAVFTDPYLGTRKAAMRRDFTVNALMEDVLTGEILDPFGGREDLEKGILRHINDASFGEDPLRVLRGAQFAARFGFTVAPETVMLCKTMDLTPLPGERVWGELQKALLKAPKPSVFFETLREMDQLKIWFPEAEALAGVPQEPRFHPEGDVWTHTMLVLDQAARLRDRAKNPMGLMLSALCHDFGKRDTTRIAPDRIRSLGHEKAGVPRAKTFLLRITREKALCWFVTNMVLLHMRPNQLAAQNSGTKAYYKLFDESLCPEDLLLLSKADALGCAVDRDYGPTENILRQQLEEYRALLSRPFVQGADLVEAGFAPGKDFGPALEYAHKLRLSGVEKKEALAQTIRFLEQGRK